MVVFGGVAGNDDGDAGLPLPFTLLSFGVSSRRCRQRLRARENYNSSDDGADAENRLFNAYCLARDGEEEEERADNLRLAQAAKTLSSPRSIRFIVAAHLSALYPYLPLPPPPPSDGQTKGQSGARKTNGNGCRRR